MVIFLIFAYKKKGFIIYYLLPILKSKKAMDRRFLYSLNVSIFCALLLIVALNVYNNSKGTRGIEIRDIVWKDINFIHTTDTHGWYSGHLNQKQYNSNWGDFISFTTHLQGIANKSGQDLLLIDTGDRHDGNGLSDATSPNGEKSLPIFLKQDYDLITIGNHELYLWENSKQEYEYIVDRYGPNYVSSNVEYKINNGTFLPFGQKYKYFETPNRNIRILSFGFLFDFTRNNEHSKVTPIREILEQDWFKDVIESYPNTSVDMIVILGHIPISHTWPELYQLHNVLRGKYPDIPIQYFGGHSHIRDFTIFDEKLTGLQSGRFCETVGWLSIDMDKSLLKAKDIFSRSYIDFNLESFMHHSNFTDIEEFNTKKGTSVCLTISETRKELKLDEQIGYVNSNYYVDYVPLSSNNNIFSLLTQNVLPTLESENNKFEALDQKIVIINTGSIRYDLYKGPYTIDTQYIVSPFKNKWVKITVPRYIATLISARLNDNDYIYSKSNRESSAFVDNRRLLPEHQFSILEKYGSNGKRQDTFQLNNNILLEPEFGTTKLTKGYVTYDDFGNTGDDTPHKPVINFPITNVVESRSLDYLLDDNSLVDVVFYDFISPNIKWALNELNYTEEVEIEFYSNVYLSKLLGNYIKSNN